MGKKHRRQYREMGVITKKKISNSHKNRSKTPAHCKAISDAFK